MECISKDLKPLREGLERQQKHDSVTTVPRVSVLEICARETGVHFKDSLGMTREQSVYEIDRHEGETLSEF